MRQGGRFDGAPRSAVVVGAGIVGLSTAWFLQERGVEVTVVDRAGAGAGASGGSAGWIAPALTLPLNHPEILRYPLWSLHDPDAPLHVPLSPDPGTARFLVQFAAHCSGESWRRAVAAAITLNQECLETYEVLGANGVEAPVFDAPITAVFRSSQAARDLLRQLRRMEDAGQSMMITALLGEALREQVPLASDAVTAGLTIHGQRFLDPVRFTAALAAAVVERGASLLLHEVVDVHDSLPEAAVLTSDGTRLSADVVVIAAGVGTGNLIGGRTALHVTSGRGFSFTVPIRRALPAPIYLPDLRVCCTPAGDDMRVSGGVEFGAPAAGASAERVAALIAATEPLLVGVDWERRGAIRAEQRPITADGRALVGRLSNSVYVASGHGLWGVTHGPVTGRTLAEQITTGKQPDALRPFDPLRAAA